MLWDGLVTLKGIRNAPATFNRCVTNLLRSVRDFVRSYSGDVFIHGRAMGGKTDVEVYRMQVLQVPTLVRNDRGIQDLSLYAGVPREKTAVDSMMACDHAAT